MDAALLLPLGVVTRQLQKVEAQLRLLGAAAPADVASARDPGRSGRIHDELERIHEALDSIVCLSAHMEAGVNPAVAKARSERDD